MSLHHLVIRLLILLVLIPLAACSGYTRSWGAPAYHQVFSDDSKGGTYVIPGADSASFHAFKGTGYAKDKDRVYYLGGVVPGADAASFVALEPATGKDDVRGYCRREPIPGSDGGTLEAIPGGGLRDKRDVFLCTQALHACDARSFRNLGDGNNWHVDDRCAYAGSSVLAGADAHTFRAINFFYAEDAQHVYSAVSGVIVGADPATFRLINHPCAVCARDKDRCYKDNREVNCDPEQAAIDWRNSQSQRGSTARPPALGDMVERFKPLVEPLNDNAETDFQKENTSATDASLIDSDAYDRYHAAAERGDAVGEYQLGVAHLFGLVIPRNAIQARAWFEMAAALRQPSGTAGRPHRGSRGRRPISLVSTSTVMASRRTMSKPWRGMARPPRKGMPARRRTSAECISRARACHGITPGPCCCFVKLLRRDSPAANPVLGSCMPTAMV